MRVSADSLLAVLPPFNNKSVLIESVQGVPDIIREVVEAHKYFSEDYDHIYQFFYNDSVERICRNLFRFCKENVQYDVESENEQTTKSPSALLAMGYGDCKHYAGFIAGVLDSIGRNTGRALDWSYRFASYDHFNSEPGHVFVVVKSRDKEFWIDPVLEDFDFRYEPVYIVDKKIISMPLYRVSGIGQVESSPSNEFFSAVESAGISVGVIPPEILDVAANQADSIIDSAFAAVEKLFADQVPDYPVKKQSTFDKIIQNVFTWAGTAAPKGVFRLRPATVSQAAEMLRKAYPNLDLQLAVPASERGEIWHTATLILQETILSLENLIAYATKSDIIPVTYPGSSLPMGVKGIDPIIASLVVGAITYFITKKIMISTVAAAGTYFIMPKRQVVYTPPITTQPYPTQQPTTPTNTLPDLGGVTDWLSDLFGGSKQTSDAGSDPVNAETEVFI